MANKNGNSGNRAHQNMAVMEYMEEVMDIRIIPGVEITHVHPDKIASLAKMARELGAEIVVVHPGDYRIDYSEEWRQHESELLANTICTDEDELEASDWEELSAYDREVGQRG